MLIFDNLITTINIFWTFYLQ